MLPKCDASLVGNNNKKKKRGEKEERKRKGGCQLYFRCASAAGPLSQDVLLP